MVLVSKKKARKEHYILLTQFHYFEFFFPQPQPFLFLRRCVEAGFLELVFITSQHSHRFKGIP